MDVGLLRISILGLVLVVICAVSAPGDALPYATIEELVDRAELIVRGPQESDDTVRVETIYKGEAKPQTVSIKGLRRYQTSVSRFARARDSSLPTDVGRSDVVVVLLCSLVACTARATSQESQQRDSEDVVGQLLTSVTEDDLDLRRQAAADLCIAMLKRNRVWRADPLNGKIPTEEHIRMAVKGVRSSKQKPDLATANMCAHCMGMLRGAVWRTPPVTKADPFAERLISIVKTTSDPVVKTILLIGLASSPTARARDVVVASTADVDLGVRKSANFLVQRCSSNSFGPLGVIHIGSPAGDVDASGQKIRAVYRWDKCVGAGWGPMEGGLQTRLVIQPTAPRVGATIAGSLLVRNVSEGPKSVLSSVHPVQHLRIIHNKEYLWPKVDPVPRPPADMTLAPGEQKTLWSFRLNDFINTSSPGKYEIWLRDTDGLLPPRSNRVLFELNPPNQKLHRPGEDASR